MTWRQLRVLIQHLPPESATMTALRNELTPEELAEQAERGEPEKGAWSQTEQLQAAAIDSLRRIEYILICANSSKGKRPDRPEPVRRPGAKAPRARAPLSEDGANTLFTLINGTA